MKAVVPAVAEKIGSLDFLIEMLEQAPVGTLLIDSDCRVEIANLAACQIMGFEAGELNGKVLSDIFGAPYRAMFDRRAWDDDSLKLVRILTRVPHEVHILTPGGKDRYIEVVFIDAASSSGHFLVYLSDIAERKQLQFELQRRNTFFHNLIESSTDGIIAADMKGRIIIFNQGAERLLGYTKEEALADLNVVRLYPEGQAQEVLKHMRSEDFGGKGRLLRHELIGITKDGRKVPMSFSGGIIYDNGEETATFGIFTDLRAMQKIEQDLQQTHQMLLQSEKMAGLGRLAAGVAHEINNPMSGITLYSNLVLEMLGQDHPAAEDLGIIIHEAERCKHIVSDLLEFSHQVTYEQIEVDINEQVRKALAILGKQFLFHNIEVDLELAPKLPRVWGNPIRMNQVLINILVNAAQAMAGCGTLTITTRHCLDGQIVEACVTDSGPGIDPQILPQIFDPFFTTKANEGGTGLGLSVCYAIVKEHRGTIHVDSTVGQGTTFCLRFPALENDPAEDPA